MTGETARAASPAATPWAFLTGAWRGAGRLRDTAITTATRFRPSLGGTLEGEIACVAGGAVVHRERALFHVHAVHGPSALSFDHAGRTTHWRVVATGPGHLEFAPADDERPDGRSRRWTLDLRPDGTLVETFGDRAQEPVVRIEHTRAPETET